MREMAPFSSFDFIGGFIYSGNPDLERSTVWNVDLRYEFFPQAGELIAASVFYKQFQDPIQQRIVPNTGGSISEITFVNVSDGTLYGLELELRKMLDFIPSTFFERLKLGVNFTYTQSEVDIAPDVIAARRRANPNLNEDTRPFQAQSPYIINANLDYLDVEHDFEVTLYMNVFGRRLVANGSGGIPDIYEIYGSGDTPTPDLRLIISKGIFENFNIGFRAENILGYQIERNVEFSDNYSVQERLEPGRTFTVSLNYSIE
jgi:outer membrane receptor protein involved in Fe transport